MKRKNTNNKYCQFAVISVVTTARTIFRSSSLTFYTLYKTQRIVSTQAVSPILTKSFLTRRFVSRKGGQTDDRSQMAMTN